MKVVSNKVGRHSSAQLWMLGSEKTVVSKMLGHAKERTTDAHFRVNVAEAIDGTRYIIGHWPFNTDRQRVTNMY